LFRILQEYDVVVVVVVEYDNLRNGMHSDWPERSPNPNPMSNLTLALPYP